VIKLAQQRARSGQHADHTTIIPLLQDMEGFEAARMWLEAPAMRLQLDRLCAAARNPRGSGLSLSELRQPALQAGREVVRGAYQKASR
jgi:hypothetical protein